MKFKKLKMQWIRWKTWMLEQEVDKSIPLWVEELCLKVNGEKKNVEIAHIPSY